MSGTLRKQDASPVADGEFAFTWADFHTIAQIVHAESGIVLADSKANLVYSRLAKRLRKIGLRSFRDYCEIVQREDGADERQVMIAAMTTNVTRFFRETHHFSLLEKIVLPPLLDRAKKGDRVRLWSSACSSGEEPYSLALTILGLMPDAGKHDILILASDLDPNMLARAETGIYSAAQVEPIPADLRRKWISAAKAEGAMSFEVTPPVRELVRFRELNLLDPWPMRGRFDVIFCRNVMIYFDDETQNGIWTRFAKVLEPDGVLCIGHSERIPASMPFELVAQTSYRLAGGGAR
ncbi:MAG: protein-glutamate O-methyltransferase [Alphaproteobacteria bacterium]|nr:protein-glutamate O-methyltransferase [Alphaproteobacteria bacterium]MDE2011461.1 protein-glutamate O-methyltransferase [Alphaproteobacteria bacterium]MDE2071852.1 protein-glutamate O-methyltransferase [Alphaproteobacteria bacterium]MDE2350475.1 protein-glutamate O-methyltransferase [Alphaproteobacteria bacterium]